MRYAATALLAILVILGAYTAMAEEKQISFSPKNHSLDNNDMRFAQQAGFSHGEAFFQYLRDAFDVLYEEGGDRPKMMSVGLHCRLAGRPGRAAALTRFLDYARSHDHVWITTRAAIAEHWRQHHPFPGRG